MNKGMGSGGGPLAFTIGVSSVSSSKIHSGVGSINQADVTNGFGRIIIERASFSASGNAILSQQSGPETESSPFFTSTFWG